MLGEEGWGGCDGVVVGVLCFHIFVVRNGTKN